MVGKTDGFMPFQRVFIQSEMQKALTRISFHTVMTFCSAHFLGLLLLLFFFLLLLLESIFKLVILVATFDFFVTKV